MKVLGIDIGGTGIKGAVVDVRHGVLKTDRLRLLTPHPAEPDAVADVLRTLTEHFEWSGPIGCTFPGVIKDGTVHTAANLVPDWVGLDASEVFAKATGSPVTVLNDADAAGLAEVTFGAARGNDGLVMVVTLGTGIGSALVYGGRLVPNTEFGHLEFHGQDAETLISGAARERRQLSWKAWAKQFNLYLSRLELYFSPDLIIFGGGVSKEYAKWGKFVKTRCEVVTATFLNTSGIIGAAYAAGAQLQGTHDAASDSSRGEPTGGCGRRRGRSRRPRCARPRARGRRRARRRSRRRSRPRGPAGSSRRSSSSRAPGAARSGRSR